MTSAPTTQLVLTIVGPDRPGIVDTLSKEIASFGGNWLESRMAHLASHFAGILLVETSSDRVDALCGRLSSLSGMSVQITLAEHSASAAEVPARAALSLTGIDQPGIVQAVTSVLAERGVNIDTLDTEVSTAPMSGEPTFEARASLQVPPGTSIAELREALERLGSHLMVDISLGAAE